ncbi:hypothetical protein LDO32_10275 [Luteimonas sp. Y-2-2-4F]|nr:hypothetical protein [Luteimonas sp. Y-2-2-4F]MCD9032107.1 hypothetical protein [Luteimonas sp. Y-2-2-4F]
MLALLAAAACSAPPPAAAAGPAHAGALRPGEYVTEKGWGRLLLVERSGALAFSIESVTGEDYCMLDGTVRGTVGVANGEDGASACAVEFSAVPQGLEVATDTPVECKAFCGYNGGFVGAYLQVASGCGRSDLDRALGESERLHEVGDDAAALATLAPVLADCLPTLEWGEEGEIRNRVAFAQYANRLYAECLATLEPYAADAAEDDDAVAERWPPVLGDRYLAIVREARTTLDACRLGRPGASAAPPAAPPPAVAEPATPGDAPFTGAWSVRWCDGPDAPGRPCGGFQAYLFQAGDRICGTYSGLDPRANRLDAGEPRSVVGVVLDRVAVLAVTSERSGGTYLATARLDGDALGWDIAGTVKEGAGGEPALIADGDRLVRSASDEESRYLDRAIRDCAPAAAEGEG